MNLFYAKWSTFHKHIELMSKVIKQVLAGLHLKSLIFQRNIPLFLWIHWRNKPRGTLGEHEKNLYITSSWATDLKALLVFSRQPKWFIALVNV